MDVIRLLRTQVDDARVEVVEIYVNGENLIELARRIEAPFAEREGHPDLAGNYTNIALRVLRPPSRHLFGAPSDPDYYYKGWTELLSCSSCGGSWCWPLSVVIDVQDDFVEWRNFIQPHRFNAAVQKVWQYESLGPFHFSRRQYEGEIEQLAPGDS